MPSFFENITTLRKALAHAVLHHTAPNTFGAAELHAEHGAPPPQAQARLGDKIAFSAGDGGQEYIATRLRATGRAASRWSVEQVHDCKTSDDCVSGEVCAHHG